MDKYPKRRKDKYNCYTLLKNNGFFIKIKDENKVEYITEITKKIYKAFNKFELNDLSQMNKYDRHIEHAVIRENMLNKRILHKELCVEDTVIKNIELENLHRAILELPKIQKKRIIMFYFKDMSLKEIAKKENCSIRAIQYSIRCALNNLKKFLKQTS